MAEPDLRSGLNGVMHAIGEVTDFADILFGGAPTECSGEAVPGHSCSEAPPPSGVRPQVVDLRSAQEQLPPEVAAALGVVIERLFASFGPREF